MKQKEIHLDFTSLLDVVMIILFFFILFTTFEVQKSNEEYDKKTAELEQEFQQLYEEIENERQKLEDAKDSSYKNYQALQDFGEGKFITFKLSVPENLDKSKISSEDLKINAFFEDSQIMTLNLSDDIVNQISSLFMTLDIHEDDAIIGIFSYNGSINGTVDVIRSMQKAVQEIQKIHEYFYFSEINTSS